MSISNEAVLGLFALLAAALVCASIWFFFRAKNGGFVFRKGDWEEYKSTVLRRKGPNGTTLSGATKTTELGGGSVVGSTAETYDTVSEKSGYHGRRDRRAKATKNSRDNDVRAYRHEKPARVGGLNREADGSYHDHTNTEPSEVAARPYESHTSKLTKKKNNETPKARKPSGRQFSYSAGTEATFSVASDDSHRPLRSSPQHHRHSANSTPAHTPRQGSPIKRSAGPSHTPHSPRGHVPGSYAQPLDFESRYTASEAGSEQIRNTKAYFHPIPGLSKTVATVGDGFRRGGGRRRDSLSDSDGETGTTRS
jgi:hypothetical protein